jgi:hypothetical protein
MGMGSPSSVLIENKKIGMAGHQWLTSVILATWEAEVKKIEV